jgi:hypothetical protein
MLKFGSRSPNSKELRLAVYLYTRCFQDGVYAAQTRESLNEERVLLLDWRVFEKAKGTLQVWPTSKRKCQDGSRGVCADESGKNGWEEYFDYQFPDD